MPADTAFMDKLTALASAGGSSFDPARSTAASAAPWGSGSLGVELSVYN